MNWMLSIDYRADTLNHGSLLLRRVKERDAVHLFQLALW